MIRRIFAVAAAIILSSTSVASTSDLNCTNPTRITGEAKSGNDFKRMIIGNGMVFALNATRNAPPNPYGWTMSIYDPKMPGDNMLWNANPHMGGLWVGNLTQNFGQTAEQIVAKTKREFAFYTDGETNAKARAYLKDPKAFTPDQYPDPQGHGAFVIDSYKLDTFGSTKAIGSMKFHVTLCLTN